MRVLSWWRCARTWEVKRSRGRLKVGSRSSRTCPTCREQRGVDRMLGCVHAGCGIAYRSAVVAEMTGAGRGRVDETLGLGFGLAQCVKDFRG